MSLTVEAQSALIVLQVRARFTRDAFQLDQIDRAADEIIRLNGVQPAPFQIRSAMANASKALRRRQGIAKFASLDVIGVDAVAPNSPIEVIDIKSWLATTHGLTEGNRRLLMAIAEHDDVDALTAEYGVSAARMRERVSRARRAARAAYAREVTAA